MPNEIGATMLEVFIVDEGMLIPYINRFRGAKLVVSDIRRS